MKKIILLSSPRKKPPVPFSGALRRALEELRAGTHVEGRIAHDPAQFLRRYGSAEDREAAGFIAGAFAYGNARVFLPFIGRLLDRLGPSPAAFLRRASPRELRARFGDLAYRFQKGRDVVHFLGALRTVLRREGSLERLFSRVRGAPRGAPHPGRKGVPPRRVAGPLFPAAGAFAEAFHAVDPRPFTGRRAAGRGYRHLLPGAASKGARKRFFLFLRWMARPGDPPDAGAWRCVRPAELVVPLDAHVARIGRYLGLLRRRTMDGAAAMEATDSLRRLCPEDPLRFDFALCHHGMSGACPARPVPTLCRACPLKGVCAVGLKVQNGGRP